jgi:hypothetical protein
MGTHPHQQGIIQGRGLLGAALDMGQASLEIGKSPRLRPLDTPDQAQPLPTRPGYPAQVATQGKVWPQVVEQTGPDPLGIARFYLDGQGLGGIRGFYRLR